MPFKSISRHQPSQQEPKLSWPSLTGKYLKNCRYHQNKTPQRNLLPKQQQSSNPKQQKAPRPLDVAGTGIGLKTAVAWPAWPRPLQQSDWHEIRQECYVSYSYHPPEAGSALRFGYQSGFRTAVSSSSGEADNPLAVALG